MLNFLSFGRSRAFEEHLRHPGGDAAFEEFKPFVRVRDPRVRTIFEMVLLKELHFVSGYNWSPRNCHYTGELEQHAIRLQSIRILNGLEVTAMTFEDVHYFLKVWLPSAAWLSQPLVIDPFGVPQTLGQDYESDSSIIIPFFGEPNLAPELHKSVYTEARPANPLAFLEYDD